MGLILTNGKEGKFFNRKSIKSNKGIKSVLEGLRSLKNADDILHYIDRFY